MAGEILKHTHPRDTWSLTRAELVAEIDALRSRNAELETLDGERKAAQQALAERERELRTANAFLEHILATSPAVIFEGEPAASHRTTYVSPNVERVRGYRREEILEDPSFWVDHIHPADRTRVLTGIERAIANRVALHTVEYRFLHKDGAYRWFYDAIHFEYDLHGTVVGGLGCQLDVTDTKQAVEALRESEERFRILFEHSPDGIFLIDPHYPDGMWRLIDCNDAACRMNGYSRDELVGQPIGLFDVGPSEPDGDRTFLARLKREGTIRAETLHRRKDGTVFPIEFSMCFISLGGRELVLGIDRDISERKVAEEARLKLERTLYETRQREQMGLVLRQNEILREVDRLKSEFVANISHELRTPLHHIKGYSALLLDPRRTLDEQTSREFLQTISESADRLGRLLTDLLDTSHIASTTLALEVEPVSIGHLVTSVVHRWQAITSHRFVAYVPDRAPLLSVDRGRIEQVLDNVLANVVRYTPAATLTTVDIEVKEIALLVSVRDHGPGVAAEHLARLFDRFYQVRSGPADSGGSGLGLFICKAIVEQHGGRIWAEPTPGSGLTICFTVPLPAT